MKERLAGIAAVGRPPPTKKPSPMNAALCRIRRRYFLFPCFPPGRITHCAGTILDRFLHHAQTIAITGRSCRLQDYVAIAGKEDKNKKSKSKSNDPGCAGGFAEARPSTAEPAS